MKKILLILFIAVFTATLTGASLEKIELKKGMKREEVEKLISQILGKESTYYVYSMYGLKEGKYDDGKITLIVKYKSGFPAPWVKTADGKIEHLPPIDAEIISWEFEKNKLPEAADQDQRPNKLERIDEEQAKKLFIAYLKKKGLKPEDYDFHLKPFGRTTWLVSCFTKELQPALGWRHLITARDVREIDEDSLNVLFMNEYPLSANTPEEKEKVIKDFLNLYTGESISIINKASDIPDHDKKPIDPDLAPAIRAPYVTKDGITVIYAYQPIGGKVFRFRFHWTEDNSFRKAEAAKLAEDIGDAQYYE